MAKLYCRYGAMGSSKTANALMVAFNYEEKGLRPLVLKPKVDIRDVDSNGHPILKSRIGLQRPCIAVEDCITNDFDAIKSFINSMEYNCIIVDEVQFCTKEQIIMFRRIVTELNIPVICYGLREDFLMNPFKIMMELISRADVIEELKTVCWCGQGATCNARLDKYGNILRTGEVFELGGNGKYTSLCRKHYLESNIGPKMKHQIININLNNFVIHLHKVMESLLMKDIICNFMVVIGSLEDEFNEIHTFNKISIISACKNAYKYSNELKRHIQLYMMSDGKQDAKPFFEIKDGKIYLEGLEITD